MFGGKTSLMGSLSFRGREWKITSIFWLSVHNNMSIGKMVFSKAKTRYDDFDGIAADVKLVILIYDSNLCMVPQHITHLRIRKDI